MKKDDNIKQHKSTESVLDKTAQPKDNHELPQHETGCNARIDIWESGQRSSDNFDAEVLIDGFESEENWDEEEPDVFKEPKAFDIPYEPEESDVGTLVGELGELNMFGKLEEFGKSDMQGKTDVLDESYKFVNLKETGINGKSGDFVQPDIFDECGQIDEPEEGGESDGLAELNIADELDGLAVRQELADELDVAPGVALGGLTTVAAKRDIRKKLPADADVFNEQHLKFSDTKLPEPARIKNNTKKRIALTQTGLIAIIALTALLCSSIGSIVVFAIISGEAKQEAVPEPVPYIIIDASSYNDSWADVVETATPSVVEIYSKKWSGSGVVISQDGYIITNNHIIGTEKKFDVVLSDGTEYTAELIGAEPAVDIAIIKIEAQGLIPARFGSSGDVRIGDRVIAIGNPLGQLPRSVTEGIVSGLDRSVFMNGTTMKLMQISVPVNQGNSGGGLFNVHGEIIGIVNAKSPVENVEGIAFAVAADTARKTAEELIGREVTGKPSIGAEIKFINDPSTARQYDVEDYGLFIIGIENAGAADAAGLQTGDHIIAIDGTTVITERQFVNIIEWHQPGERASIEIIRDNAVLVVTVTVQFKNNMPL